MATAEEWVGLNVYVRRSYRSGVLLSPPKCLRVLSYRWSRSALASRCLPSMSQGTQSSRPGCGCSLGICWRIFRTVRASWGLMPLRIPEFLLPLLQIDPQPLRCYLCRCSLFQIRSSDLRNSPPLCGLVRSRLQKTLLIHQTGRPQKTRATRPSWMYPQLRCSITPAAVPSYIAWSAGAASASTGCPSRPFHSAHRPLLALL